MGLCLPLARSFLCTAVTGHFLWRSRAVLQAILGGPRGPYCVELVLKGGYTIQYIGDMSLMISITDGWWSVGKLSYQIYSGILSGIRINRPVWWNDRQVWKLLKWSHSRIICITHRGCRLGKICFFAGKRIIDSAGWTFIFFLPICRCMDYAYPWRLDAGKETDALLTEQHLHFVRGVSSHVWRHWNLKINEKIHIQVPKALNSESQVDLVTCRWHWLQMSTFVVMRLSTQPRAGSTTTNQRPIPKARLGSETAPGGKMSVFLTSCDGFSTCFRCLPLKLSFPHTNI